MNEHRRQILEMLSAGKITESSAGAIAASTLAGSSGSTATMTAEPNFCRTEQWSFGAGYYR